jgi:hypothetical protein
MKRTLASLIALVISAICLPAANSAYLADCIVATNANLRDSGFEKVYEVTLKNACGDTFKESLNYTGLSFYADYSTINPEQDSIFYLQTYGSTYTFKLRNLKSGSYRPYLKIFVPKDYSNKTINLPGFTIANPLDCIQLSSSQYNSDFFAKTLTIVLKNACSSLSSRDFSNLQLSLEIPGYFGYISSKTIFSLDSYGTDFRFELPDIKAGSYSPQLTVKDSNFNSRRFALATFQIVASPKPTPSPSSSVSKQPTARNSQLCAVARNFADLCSDFPNFLFELCSSLQNAQLQEKVGNSWINLWKVKGKKDSSRCSSSSNPYLVSVSGTNATNVNTALRLVFAKTSRTKSFTQVFSLENR